MFQEKATILFSTLCRELVSNENIRAHLWLRILMKNLLFALLCVLTLTVFGRSQEDPRARQLFEQLEQKLKTAQTVSVSFTTTINHSKGLTKSKLESAGTVVFAQKNKLKADVAGKSEGDFFYLWKDANGFKFVSNDLNSVLIVGIKTPLPEAKNSSPIAGNSVQTTPTNIDSNNIALSRLGRAGVLDSFFFMLQVENLRSFLNSGNYKSIVVDNFQMSKKEKIGDRTAQIINYHLTFLTGSWDEKKYFVSLWLDTENNLPLKRVLTVDTADGSELMTEIYGRFSLDEVVEPNIFKHPAIEVSRAEVVNNLINELKKSQLLAYEANAVSSLRIIYGAQETYKVINENGNYGTLEQLAQQELITSDLASGNKSGYKFNVYVYKNSFRAVAEPTQCTGEDVTGTKSFLINETGVLRVSDEPCQGVKKSYRVLEKPN